MNVSSMLPLPLILPSPLIVSGGSITADDESPLMPFMEKIGTGLNDKEDAPGRENKTTNTRIADTSDLRIIFADIRFDMCTKEGCGEKDD